MLLTRLPGVVCADTYGGGESDMDQPGQIDRRIVLKRATVLGGAAVAAMASAPSVLADDGEASHSLEGGWTGSTEM